LSTSSCDKTVSSESSPVRFGRLHYLSKQADRQKAAPSRTILPPNLRQIWWKFSFFFTFFNFFLEHPSSNKMDICQSNCIFNQQGRGIPYTWVWLQKLPRCDQYVLSTVTAVVDSDNSNSCCLLKQQLLSTVTAVLINTSATSRSIYFLPTISLTSILFIKPSIVLILEPFIHMFSPISLPIIREICIVSQCLLYVKIKLKFKIYF